MNEKDLICRFFRVMSYVYFGETQPGAGALTR